MNTQRTILFDGKTFDARLDGERLSGQLATVRDYLLAREGRFVTVAEISAALGFPECSVSAQLRNLRKPRYGGYRVEARRLTENGLFAYRITAADIPTFREGAGKLCWHCGGDRLCNCIVCGIAEGLGTRGGPCQVCAAPRHLAAS